ncbi:Uncharacterised protein [Psychrobacter phenylpyruvicus]|uniref:Uncharacterized protein n=1 Tax=Psychrobacter phenylpyruvicus TaxID=29432 RepID=A0A379LMY1_9GAMM|nr:Uncharacterised protein [Psychrobacter phenylpyruvicus]
MQVIGSLFCSTMSVSRPETKAKAYLSGTVIPNISEARVYPLEFV